MMLEVIDPGTRINEVTDSSGGLGFNQRALQRYILHCAQNMTGGLRQTGKSRDFITVFIEWSIDCTMV